VDFQHYYNEMKKPKNLLSSAIDVRYQEVGENSVFHAIIIHICDDGSRWCSQIVYEDARFSPFIGGVTIKHPVNVVGIKGYEMAVLSASRCWHELSSIFDILLSPEEHLPLHSPVIVVSDERADSWLGHILVVQHVPDSATRRVWDFQGVAREYRVFELAKASPSAIKLALGIASSAVLDGTDLLPIQEKYIQFLNSLL